MYPGKTITIGKPLANTQVYILDADQQPVPVGVAGEIYLAGVGLARGYYNRPELTAETFVDNPFQPGRKMYRSGDLGRWLSNGEIEFMDRLDYQVKIRGFRIELGEIENRLLAHTAIKEAVVIDLTDESETKYLVAYYVADSPMAATELKTALANDLPDYMIPAYFMQLPQLPLSLNGKIDRKALPKPERKSGRISKFVAPRNPIEINLAEIWSNVLKVKEISVDDNFFELGGHSLKATAIVARVYKEMDMILPLKEIFKTPTISGLADYLRDAERQSFTAIQVTEESHYYNVS
jgi:acyl carrier protein